VDAASAALTAETGQDRWATVLDALAFSPIRRRVVPQSLPTKLSPQLRTTVARVGTRLPEIAHIFAIEPEESTGRAPRSPARRSPSRGKKARTGPKPAAEANGGDGEASGNPADETGEASGNPADETGEASGNPADETGEASARQQATAPEEPPVAEEASAPQEAAAREEASTPQDASAPEEATAK
jgi:hypothetical protein